MYSSCPGLTRASIKFQAEATPFFERLCPAMTAVTYTAAVVTPPSITMVCPVMKLDASEPR
jgi:hypothetical protein